MIKLKQNPVTLEQTWRLKTKQRNPSSYCQRLLTPSVIPPTSTSTNLSQDPGHNLPQDPWHMFITDQEQKSKHEQDATLGIERFYFNQIWTKGRLKRLVAACFNSMGGKRTVDVVEMFKNLGYDFSTYAGMSIGIDDLLIPKSKVQRVFNARTHVTTTLTRLNQAHVNQLEYYHTLITTWNLINIQVRNEVIRTFRIHDTLNPVYMMAFSGARGNIAQVRQLTGMRGLISDPLGEVVNFAIESNFREGLTLTEYMISCYGARKGVVDTALRTATSGYLTRRLVDVAQHVIVSRQDCLTLQGIRVQANALQHETFNPKQRFLGRVVARPIIVDGCCWARRNQEISAKTASGLGRCPVDWIMRSPLTCEDASGICRMCYGWNLSSSHMVSLGECVGVIAGQSIGEPGTQLTMRTFHTGGVFSTEIQQQLLSPGSGHVFFDVPLVGQCVRTEDGRIGFLVKQEATVLIGETPLLLASFTLIFMKHAQYIQENQVIGDFSYQPESQQRTMQTLNASVTGQIHFEPYDAVRYAQSSGLKKTVKRQKVLDYFRGQESMLRPEPFSSAGGSEQHYMKALVSAAMPLQQTYIDQPPYLTPPYGLCPTVRWGEISGRIAGTVSSKKAVGSLRKHHASELNPAWRFLESKDPIELPQSWVNRNVQRRAKIPLRRHHTRFWLLSMEKQDIHQASQRRLAKDWMQYNTTLTYNLNTGFNPNFSKLTDAQTPAHYRPKSFSWYERISLSLKAINTALKQSSQIDFSHLPHLTTAEKTPPTPLYGEVSGRIAGAVSGRIAGTVSGKTRGLIQSTPKDESASDRSLAQPGMTASWKQKPKTLFACKNSFAQQFKNGHDNQCMPNRVFIPPHLTPPNNGSRIAGTVSSTAMGSLRRQQGCGITISDTRCLFISQQYVYVHEPTKTYLFARNATEQAFKTKLTFKHVMIMPYGQTSLNFDQLGIQQHDGYLMLKKVIHDLYSPLLNVQPHLTPPNGRVSGRIAGTVSGRIAGTVSERKAGTVSKRIAGTVTSKQNPGPLLGKQHGDVLQVKPYTRETITLFKATQPNQSSMLPLTFTVYHDRLDLTLPNHNPKTVLSSLAGRTSLDPTYPTLRWGKNSWDGLSEGESRDRLWENSRDGLWESQNDFFEDPKDKAQVSVEPFLLPLITVQPLQSRNVLAARKCFYTFNMKPASFVKETPDHLTMKQKPHLTPPNSGARIAGTVSSKIAGTVSSETVGSLGRPQQQTKVWHKQFLQPLSVLEGALYKPDIEHIWHVNQNRVSTTDFQLHFNNEQSYGLCQDLQTPMSWGWKKSKWYILPFQEPALFLQASPLLSKRSHRKMEFLQGKDQITSNLSHYDQNIADITQALHKILGQITKNILACVFNCFELYLFMIIHYGYFYCFMHPCMQFKNRISFALLHLNHLNHHTLQSRNQNYTLRKYAVKNLQPKVVFHPGYMLFSFFDAYLSGEASSKQETTFTPPAGGVSIAGTVSPKEKAGTVSWKAVDQEKIWPNNVLEQLNNTITLSKTWPLDRGLAAKWGNNMQRLRFILQQIYVIWYSSQNGYCRLMPTRTKSYHQLHGWVSTLLPIHLRYHNQLQTVGFRGNSTVIVSSCFASLNYGSTHGVNCFAHKTTDINQRHKQGLASVWYKKMGHAWKRTGQTWQLYLQRLSLYKQATLSRRSNLSPGSEAKAVRKKGSIGLRSQTHDFQNRCYGIHFYIRRHCLLWRCLPFIWHTASGVLRMVHLCQVYINIGSRYRPKVNMINGSIFHVVQKTCTNNGFKKEKHPSETSFYPPTPPNGTISGRIAIAGTVAGKDSEVSGKVINKQIRLKRKQLPLNQIKALHQANHGTSSWLACTQPKKPSILRPKNHLYLHTILFKSQCHLTMHQKQHNLKFQLHKQHHCWFKNLHHHGQQGQPLQTLLFYWRKNLYFQARYTKVMYTLAPWFFQLPYIGLCKNQMWWSNVPFEIEQPTQCKFEGECAAYSIGRNTNQWRSKLQLHHWPDPTGSIKEHNPMEIKNLSETKTQAQTFMTGLDHEAKPDMQVYLVTEHNLTAYQCVSPDVAHLGAFLTSEQRLCGPYRPHTSGQVFWMDKSTVVVRRADCYNLPQGSKCLLYHRGCIDRHTGLLNVFYQKVTANDIIQGIAKIEGLFEAKNSDTQSITSIAFQMTQFYQPRLSYKSRQYTLNQILTEIQFFIIIIIQAVYKEQGVDIADKHLEVIVRQMTSKVRVVDPKDSGLLRTENIHYGSIGFLNSSYDDLAFGPIIGGITQTALHAASFLSAASFQETLNVLTRTSFSSSRDFLDGVKGNTIIGQPVPMGTDRQTPISLIDLPTRSKRTLSSKASHR